MKTNKFTIRLLPAAESDLNEIIDYIAADNPSAAVSVAEKIEKSLSHLTNFPSMGKIPRDEDLAASGYHYLIVEEHLIFYTIEGKTIFVHRILHGARDYKNLL